MIKALSYPLLKLHTHEEFCTSDMQSENKRKKKQTLQDCKIQGTNFDLKYLGPFANTNTPEILWRLTTLLCDFSHSKEEKHHQNYYNILFLLFCICSSLTSLHSLFCPIQFILQSKFQSPNSQPETNKKDLLANLLLHPDEMGSSPASQLLLSNLTLPA